MNSVNTRVIKAKRSLSIHQIEEHGNFVERAKRLRRIVDGLEITAAFPLLYEVKLDSSIFNILEAAAKQYIFASLNVGREQKIFDMKIDPVKKFPQECVNLPNRTPNGLLMPKRENSFEFNIVCRAIAEMLSTLGMERRVESVMTPMMLRLINGKDDKEAGKRPYASTKIHTDIWSGGPAKLISCFIPVMGDIQKTTMSLWEPSEEVMKSYVHKMSDYAEGQNVGETALRYDIELKHGCVYFFDSYLLHKTIKRNGYPRLSIDLRLVPKENIKWDKIKHHIDHQNWKLQFLNIKDWYDVAHSQIIVSNNTFEEARATFTKPVGVKKSKKQPNNSVDYTKYFKYIDLF